MKTAIIPLEDIRPAAYNPRVTLKPGDKEYEALKNSIEQFGAVVPLIVNSATGNLISGHQRYNILREAGAAEAEVVLLDIPLEEEKALNVALNKVDGEWDMDKLQQFFDGIDYGDIQVTGFTPDELESLFGEAERELPSVIDGLTEGPSRITDAPVDLQGTDPAEDTRGQNSAGQMQPPLYADSGQYIRAPEEAWATTRGQEEPEPEADAEQFTKVPGETEVPPEPPKTQLPSGGFAEVSHQPPEQAGREEPEMTKLYLSFPSEQSAKVWLVQMGIPFSDNDSANAITVHMTPEGKP